MVGRAYTSTRSVTNMSKPYRRKKWDRNVNASSSVLATAPHAHFHVIIVPYPPYVFRCFRWYFMGGPPPYITGFRQGTPLIILCWKYGEGYPTIYAISKNFLFMVLAIPIASLAATSCEFFAPYICTNARPPPDLLNTSVPLA